MSPRLFIAVPVAQSKLANKSVEIVLEAQQAKAIQRHPRRLTAVCAFRIAVEIGHLGAGAAEPGDGRQVGAHDCGAAGLEGGDRVGHDGGGARAKPAVKDVVCGIGIVARHADAGAAQPSLCSKRACRPFRRRSCVASSRRIQRLALTLSRIAASRTVRTSGPAVSWLWAIGMISLRLISPAVGLW